MQTSAGVGVSPASLGTLLPPNRARHPTYSRRDSTFDGGLSGSRDTRSQQGGLDRSVGHLERIGDLSSYLDGRHCRCWPADGNPPEVLSLSACSGRRRPKWRSRDQRAG